MDIRDFLKYLDVDFFAGVPDSQLKSLCDYLVNTYGISKKHIIAANEGNAVALAAGFHLSTGKIPCVYLQNSGLGNIINPVASLLNDRVYAIPCIFIIGWRGEPNIHDEPQHLFQGETTLEILKAMEIEYKILDIDTTHQELKEDISKFGEILDRGKSVAFVVKKGSLTYGDRVEYSNQNPALREDIIEAIVGVSGEDIIVSTTGKTSRELYEIREKKGESHKYDFLTVGSMGHSSSIALGIAINKPQKKVWCIDGDGAMLMHMGALATIGAQGPDNFIHVVINNGAHESVGGQPTVADKMNFSGMALNCGYKSSYFARDLDEFNRILEKVKEEDGPIFIEVKSAIGSRKNLGRPDKTPLENKRTFMEYLREDN